MKIINIPDEGRKIVGTDYISGNSGIDSSTESIMCIDYEHHEIHSGSHFYLCGFETIDDAGTAVFSITTPNTTEELHMTFAIQGTSQTELAIYEGAAITGGTATTALNNNRNSSHTSAATIVKNPTINTAGTLIYSYSSGFAGVTPQATRSDEISRREREIVLKTNTTYNFIITSRDDGNIVSYCGEWYEHVPKN